MMAALEEETGFPPAVLAERRSPAHKLCIVSRQEGTHDGLPLCEEELMAWILANHSMAGWKALPLEPPQTVEIGIAATSDRTMAAQAFFDLIQANLWNGKTSGR